MTTSVSHNGGSAASLTIGGDASLEDLIEECTNRLQRGESVDIEDLARDHPSQADRLRRILPSLQMMADVGRSAVREITGLAVPADPSLGLGELGDFRIIREVGRGGMGVVYEAEQISLRSRVALKVLPFAAAMDPTQLRRFQTEALAAAQLHHTNIVPVHSVGSERGVHYYAMQFIDGQTLAAVIAECRRIDGPDDPHPPLRGTFSPREKVQETPLPPGEGGRRPGEGASGCHQETLAKHFSSTAPSPRSREFFRLVAELGIQAAEALDYAHKVGIIHRDIKPANLLLDEAGNLWITDFGLARFQEDTGLTMTGHLLGTLRYMSPEQALAKRGYLDHRTDIYSLGVTIYELLTLRPAIDGQDRQEVLRKIAQEEPTPPRRFDPAIPRKLETILLNAMSKEPGSRYATAKELADDHERFLEHKPIRGGGNRDGNRDAISIWDRNRDAISIDSNPLRRLRGKLIASRFPSRPGFRPRSKAWAMKRSNGRRSRTLPARSMIIGCPIGRGSVHEARLPRYRTSQGSHESQGDAGSRGMPAVGS